MFYITKSMRKDKKYTAHFENGTKTHFGGSGYKDFILYSTINSKVAKQKRRAYIARHGSTENWSNPKDASTLSRFILWEKPTLEQAIRAYKKRFRLS